MEIKDKLEVSGRIGSVEKIFAAPPALPKKSWKNQVQSPTNFISYMDLKDELEVRGRIGTGEKILAAPPALPKKLWKILRGKTKFNQQLTLFSYMEIKDKLEVS
jgi:hypothetical protein